MKLSEILTLTGALVVAGVILFVWGGQDPQVFGSATGTDGLGLDYTRYALGFVSMLVGIVLGGFFRVLQAMKEAGHSQIESYTVLTREVIRSIDFAISIVAAPVVYVMLIKTTDGIADLGLAVIALENGFFCNVAIQNLVTAKPDEAAT